MGYPTFTDPNTGVLYNVANNPCVPNPRGTYTSLNLLIPRLILENCRTMLRLRGGGRILEERLHAAGGVCHDLAQQLTRRQSYHDTRRLKRRGR